MAITTLGAFSANFFLTEHSAVNVNVMERLNAAVCVVTGDGVAEAKEIDVITTGDDHKDAAQVHAGGKEFYKEVVTKGKRVSQTMLFQKVIAGIVVADRDTTYDGMIDAPEFATDAAIGKIFFHDKKAIARRSAENLRNDLGKLLYKPGTRPTHILVFSTMTDPVAKKVGMTGLAVGGAFAGGMAGQAITGGAGILPSL